MLIIDLSGTKPLIRDKTTKHVIAQSVIEFFQFLKQMSEISISDAKWCGVCMSYMIAIECVNLGYGISNTALSKRSDAVSFPFTNAGILNAFQDGMRIGEEALLQERNKGEEHALHALATRLNE